MLDTFPVEPPKLGVARSNRARVTISFKYLQLAKHYLVSAWWCANGRKLTGLWAYVLKLRIC
jgi:hypothetical protein